MTLIVGLPAPAFTSSTVPLDANVTGLPENSNPRVSQNGAMIAFEVSEKGEVAGDTNKREDVLVYNRLNNTTQRASLDPSGAEFPENSFSNGICASGQYVLFTVDFSSGPGIYIRDMTGLTTEEIHVSHDGLPVG